MKSNALDGLPPVLNANQLAATLSISRASAYNLMARADFPTLRIVKRKLVDREKLRQWMDAHTEGGESP